MKGSNAKTANRRRSGWAWRSGPLGNNTLFTDKLIRTDMEFSATDLESVWNQRDIKDNTFKLT